MQDLVSREEVELGESGRNDDFARMEENVGAPERPVAVGRVQQGQPVPVVRAPGCVRDESGQAKGDVARIVVFRQRTHLGNGREQFGGGQDGKKNRTHVRMIPYFAWQGFT